MMKKLESRFRKYSFQTRVDLHKWAVIACDQFTSNLSNWERVTATVETLLQLTI